MRTIFVLLWLVMLAPLHVFAQTLEPIHAGDITKIRASCKGKPLIVHVWSLTCAPCLVELPEWAKRIRRNPNVAFVFINTDGTRQATVAARRLAGVGLKPTRSLIYAEDFIERLQYEIDPTWHGELPLTQWVSENGKSSALIGPVSALQFEKWLHGER